MRSFRNPEYPGLIRVISVLRAIEWVGRAAHWKVQGNYGDHLLFERIYKLAEEGLDGLVERTIGYGTTFDEVDVSARVQGLVTPTENTAAGWCRKLLSLETQLTIAVNACLQGQTPLPVGLENFLQDLADEHSTAVYLLQQRVSQRAAANSSDAEVVGAAATAITRSGWVKPRSWGRSLTLKAGREAIPALRQALARRDKKAFVRAWGKAALGGMGDSVFDGLIAGAIVIPALTSGTAASTVGGAAGAAAAGPGGGAAGGLVGGVTGAASGAYTGYLAVKPLLANPWPGAVVRRGAEWTQKAARAAALAPIRAGLALPGQVNKALLGKKGRRAMTATQNPRVWTEEEVRAQIQTDDRWAERAICALARRQTRREYLNKSTHDDNGVGFSAAHARVGTMLAEWMTMGRLGHHQRPLTGTMQYKGAQRPRIEVARDIALHYVPQLTILANMEGPAQSKRNPWGS